MKYLQRPAPWGMDTQVKAAEQLRPRQTRTHCRLPMEISMAFTMSRMTSRFLLACLIGSVSLLCPQWMAFAESQPSEPSRVLLFSPAMGNHGGATFEREIAPEETIPLAGEYRLRALVALQQEPVQQVSDTVELKWSFPSVVPDGWQENSGRWHSTPGAQGSAISFPIAPPNQGAGQRPSTLGDFDELWFDYRDLGGSDNCALSFKADALASTGQKGTISLKLEGEDGFAKWRPTLRVQAAEVAWLPKDNLYLAKRVLGMKFDELWRYTQDGEKTVVQRRFHQSLDGLEALDFQFLPGTQIAGINLHVAHGDRRTADTVIPWDAIPHQIESTEGGLMRVRLQIGEWLKQKGNASGDSQKIYLMEAVVFLTGEAGEIAQSRPLKELVFWANETKEGSEPSAKEQHISLDVRAESLALGYKRWILDLRPLRSKWLDVRLGRATLDIRPRDQALQCALQPLALSLASQATGKEPFHIAEMRRRSISYGGPFDAADPLKKEVEWVEVDAYVPLSLLPDRLYPEPNKINMPEWGLQFLVSQGRRTFHSPDGFTFNGQGGWIETTWELPDVLTQSSSTLFLQIPQGAEHVRSGRAQIDFSGGGGATVNFLPNRPIPLGSAVSGKRVSRITLHLEMDDGPATLKMQELTLFHPFLISQEKAFSARRPFWEFLPLRAEENGERINGKPFLDKFVVHGAAEPGKAAPKMWRTSVDTVAKNLTAVKVVYALSELPHETCWLTLRARTEHKQTSLTLCPAGTQGQLIQPLAQVVKELGADETVLAFEWEANPYHATTPLAFDIQTQLGSSSQPSVRELLTRNFLVELGRQNHFPVAEANEDDFLKGGNGWIDFGKIKLESGQPLNIEAAFSPYFQVRKFTFESERPLAAKDMSQLFPSENRPSAWPARLTKLAFLAVLGGAAWLLWRRGIWQKSGKVLWPPMYGLMKGLGTLSGRFLLWGAAAVYARRRALNRAALLAAFPSAWLLAKLGGVVYLDGLLGFAAMFSVAALWHEMRWGSRETTFTNNSPPDGVTPHEFLVILLATCVSLGWAAWAQGMGHPLFTALAPLAGVSYFCLAWWKKILSGARSPAGGVLMLSGITAVLYALGLLQPHAQGGNYFFTFGGIVAVFSWRAFMRYAKESVFRARPAWAKIIYRGRGSIYFFGALIFLVITTGIVMLNLAPVAEQVAVIVYYFLVVGTILEVLALRRDARKGDKPATEETAG